MIENLEQIRAKNAFSFVSRDDIKNNKEVGELLKRLPVMFNTNGLLATYAFLFKKNEKIAGEVTEHLQKVNKISATDSAQDIFRNNWLNNDNFTTVDFFKITDEVIKYSNWLKRAAEALMPN